MKYSEFITLQDYFHDGKAKRIGEILQVGVKDLLVDGKKIKL